jgi:HEAT repeat protein
LETVNSPQGIAVIANCGLKPQNTTTSTLWIHPMSFTRSIACSSALLAAYAFSAAASVAVADDASTSAEQEQQLIAVLRSDAPAAEKAIACKNLAIYGSSEAVSELAKLLPDPQLSSWSRIALEAIPAAAADAALREAAESLQGQLLVGTINSIGVRRDAGAADSLAKRLRDRDAEVASAAAVALGRIGNDTAAVSLRAALNAVPENVRSAVAEGCVLCAERFYAQGNSATAIEIYDEVRAADVPMQRIVEATRGAILAREENGLPLLVDTFRSSEIKLQQIALATAREFPGDQVDRAMADELAAASPHLAALIIQAMADRPDTVVLDSVVQAARQGPAEVRRSAIEALRRVGNESCLSSLLAVAAEDDVELKQAAEETLAVLPGANVDAQIVAMLPVAKGEDHVLLLQLIAKRRIDAVEQVVKALDNSDPTIRSAALVALGQTVSLNRLALLVSAVMDSKNAEDADVAKQALRTASVRMPDREACATVLTKALPLASSTTKTTLLEILTEVGGSTALKTIHAAAISSDPQLQDDGSRLLGKWNSVEAAPNLLHLATNAPADKYKLRALRGYIGIARKFPMPESKRAAMCREAFDISRRLDEKKLVLEVLTLHPSVDGLNVAIRAQNVSELKNDSTQATLIIVKKLADKGVDVSALVADDGLDPVKLEIVRAVYGTGDKSRDVTAIIRRQADNSRWISLASTSYNASFGGDPVPGHVKELKIQYRIDGKPGEASFAENSLILLPMPK